MNISGIINAPPPSSPSPQPLVVHGAPLGLQGEQTATKTNAIAGDILKWMVVFCAGISMAFFFSGICIGFSSFGVPYLISIIATLVFAFATPKNPHPQRQGSGIVPPLIPQDSKRTGADVTIPFLPPPQFVDGQPLQLNNDGSSCFINSVFWAIMALPVYKDALVQSCKEWDACFIVLEKFKAWLLNPIPDKALNKDDLRLLISLLSTPDFDTWYKTTDDNASDALKQFDAQIQACRKAREEGKDDPLLSDETLDQILPLFNYDRHWTEADIATFIQLMKWLKAKGNSVKAPTVGALKQLESILSRPEYVQRFRVQIESVAKGEGAQVQLLTDFVAQVNTLIELRLQNSQDLPPVDALIVAKDPFFDFWTVGVFVARAQDLNPKIRGIKGFLNAIDTYDEACSKKAIHTNMGLSVLRQLLPAARRQGQQDASDMLRALFDLIDIRKFPNLFCSLAVERRYAPYNPPKDNLEAVQAEQQRLENAKSKELSRMPPECVKCDTPVPAYEFYLNLPDAPGFGQRLFNQSFEFCDGLAHDAAVYINSTNEQPCLYQIQAERFQVKRFPKQFIITLKRFTEESVKNDQQIIMPQYLEFKTDKYEVVAIVQHQGGFNSGHFITFVKDGQTWWICNDQAHYIRKATEQELRGALTYGYQYFLRKVEEGAVVPQLTDWPPAALPPEVVKDSDTSEHVAKQESEATPPPANNTLEDHPD